MRHRWMRHPVFTPWEYCASVVLVGAACFLLGRL